MNEFQYFIIAGCLLIMLVVFFFAWILGGFFWPFMRVKSSRGKFILVRIVTINRDYFRPGQIVDGHLKYKSLNKETKRIPLGDEHRKAIYRSFNISCIDVDDEKNIVYDRNSQGVATLDAVKVDSLLTRALMKPMLGQDKWLIILIMVLGVMLLVLGNIYLTYKNTTVIIQTLESMKTIGLNNTV